MIITPQQKKMEMLKFLQNENKVSFLIVVFTVLPFVILSFFNVPIGDDFAYAKVYIDNGFVGSQVKWYNEWSGRYMSSMAIGTFNPLSFGNLGLAFITPLVLIFGVVFSLKSLIKNVVKTFKLQVSSNLIFAVVLFFYFNYLPDFGETFYWYAGAFTYQLPIIFLLLYFNSLINIFKTNQTNFYYLSNVLLSVLSLIIILGSNEVMVVYTVGVNLILTLLLFFNDRNKLLKFTTFLIVSIGLAVFMLSAPGNFARASLFQKSEYHLIKTIIHTLSRGGFVYVFWFFSFALLILCIPNLHKIKIPVEKIAYFEKKKTWFWLVCAIVFLYGLVCIGFFPSIYTTSWIPKRAYTSILFIFILFASILFVLGINRVKILTSINKTLTQEPFNFIILLLLVVSLSVDSNVMKAYKDLGTGKAVGYHKQVTETYQMLNSIKKDTVFVKELNKKPEILPIRWPERNNRLVNSELEDYFEIKRIELE